MEKQSTGGDDNYVPTLSSSSWEKHQLPPDSRCTTAEYAYEQIKAAQKPEGTERSADEALEGEPVFSDWGGFEESTHGSVYSVLGEDKSYSGTECSLGRKHQKASTKSSSTHVMNALPKMEESFYELYDLNNGPVDVREHIIMVPSQYVLSELEDNWMSAAQNQQQKQIIPAEDVESVYCYDQDNINSYIVRPYLLVNTSCRHPFEIFLLMIPHTFQPQYSCCIQFYCCNLLRAMHM